MNALMRRAMNSKGMGRYFSALAGPFVTIFMLHRPEPEDGSFNGLSEKLLERCLHYALECGYAFASIDEVVEAAFAGKPVSRPTLCFTLDDGYADQVSRLVPLLLQYEAKPTMFTITDFVDGVDWPWDAKVAYAVKHSPLQALRLVIDGETRNLDCSTPQARIQSRRQITAYAKTLRHRALAAFVAEVEAACQFALSTRAPKDYRPASWDMLRASEKEGLRVGSHSRSHSLLNALDDQQVSTELAHSRMRLSAELNNPSNVFCYPSGTAEDFSSRHEDLVKEAGYKAAVSTVSRTAYFKEIRENPYRITRIGFPRTLEQFARYSSWLEALRSKLPL